MDNLTHGLTGALMGQMGLKKKTGLGLAALVLGANLPDIDVVGLLWLDSTEALGFRRGITHGPIGVALLPIGLAALLWGFDRWQDSRGRRPEGRDPVSFKWLYVLGLIGAISHSLMDWLNVYGVRFLYPFDKSWYYGDTLFIIDVWLWAGLALGIWWSVRAERNGDNAMRKAQIAMVLAIGYVGMNWVITTVAESQLMAREPRAELAIASPVPFAFWERERIAGDGSGSYLVNEEERGGDPYLENCNLVGAAERSSQIQGYLTWTRAPFVEPDQDGGFVLRDARFLDPRLGDRFSVQLPSWTCISVEPAFVDGKPNIVGPPEPPAE